MKSMVCDSPTFKTKQFHYPNATSHLRRNLSIDNSYWWGHAERERDRRLGSRGGFCESSNTRAKSKQEKSKKQKSKKAKKLVAIGDYACQLMKWKFEKVTKQKRGFGIKINVEARLWPLSVEQCECRLRTCCLLILQLTVVNGHSKVIKLETCSLLPTNIAMVRFEFMKRQTIFCFAFFSPSRLALAFALALALAFTLALPLALAFLSFFTHCFLRNLKGVSINHFLKKTFRFI